MPRSTKGSSKGDEAPVSISKETPKESLDKLKVTDLRSELKKRSLSATGKKSELVDRLFDAVQKETGTTTTTEAAQPAATEAAQDQSHLTVQPEKRPETSEEANKAEETSSTGTAEQSTTAATEAPSSVEPAAPAMTESNLPTTTSGTVASIESSETKPTTAVEVVSQEVEQRQPTTTTESSVQNAPDVMSTEESTQAPQKRKAEDAAEAGIDTVETKRPTLDTSSTEPTHAASEERR